MVLNEYGAVSYMNEIGPQMNLLNFSGAVELIFQIILSVSSHR
ncbi:MAG: hypothetical protein ON057_000213 [Glomeribacter sp. 1016415]|nr:hypothetical protein [Glomeribacter sp. 1016415]GAM52428.1 hypothetical protein EBME_0891 [bacterium endosymbiont of Mortierella elongata FMR23-6]